MRFSNESWNMVQIKELCSVVSGGTPSTEESSFWNGNIQWFTPTEVGNNKYVTFSKRTITELGLKKSSAKLLPAGSILLSTRATVGEASICTKECTTNQGFQSLIPNNKCCNEFLYYLIQTKKKEMIKRSCGSTFNEISNSQVGSIKVRIPSLEQQMKISKFLSHIDKRIDTQNKIISDLESLYNGIKEKIIKCANNQQSIADFLEEVVKKTTVQDEFPVLSSTVKGLFLQTDYFKRNIASENNIGYKIVKKNQIIISPQNLWMGNMTFNDKFENGIVSPSYKVYKIKEGYDADYIVSILTTKRAFYYYSQVSEQGASVVRRNLNIDAFEQLSFPVPSFEKQKEFSRLIRSIRNKLVCENNYLENLILQKKYLLENLFI